MSDSLQTVEAELHSPTSAEQLPLSFSAIALRYIIYCHVAAVAMLTLLILSNVDGEESARRAAEPVTVPLMLICLAALAICPMATMAIFCSSKVQLTAKQALIAIAAELFLVWFQWVWIIKPSTNL